MPEYPDVQVYVERLESIFVGRRLERIEIANPFLLRTVDPPLEAFEDQALESVGRIGKRIIMGFSHDLYAAIHLMISGRLRIAAKPKSGARAAPSARRPRDKRLMALIVFENETLRFTEASTRKQSSLHLVRGRESLAEFERGGVFALTAGLQEFAAALRRENHTIKRSLTDPRVIDGVGNAYSDEILHRARLSPFLQTQKMTGEQIEAVYSATGAVLTEFTAAIRAEVGDGFPDKVTAFRPEMAVHGKYGEPCPRCGHPIQRIRYADNETNYCANCQTGGTLLADRALSRLLKDDWPRSIDDLEALRKPRD